MGGHPVGDVGSRQVGQQPVVEADVFDDVGECCQLGDDVAVGDLDALGRPVVPDV